MTDASQKGIPVPRHDDEPHRDQHDDRTGQTRANDAQHHPSEAGTPTSSPAGLPALSAPVSPPRWYGTDTTRTGSTPPTASATSDALGDIPAFDTATVDGAAHPAPPEAIRSTLGDRSAHHLVADPVGGARSSVVDGTDHHGTDHRRTDQGDTEDHLSAGGLGPDASLREIARAARSAFVGRDLLQSGPALWPFGSRARQRRTRNRQAAAEAQRRRARFHNAFDGAFDGATASATSTPPTQEPQARQQTPAETRSSSGLSRRRSVDRRANAVAIVGLTGVVLVVVLALAWRGEPEPSTRDEPVAGPSSSSAARSSSRPASTTLSHDGSLAPRPPIPPGGVVPVPPGPGTSIVDPRTVGLVEAPTGDPTAAELSSPDGAMRAWLSRLCPFEFTDAFGTSERRAQPAMTDTGWATLNPDNDTPRAERARASWDTTVAARESGRCAEPAAAISPEAPRSDASAIVIGAITRVITTQTASEQAPYVEQLSEVRIVRRGTDGLWRVDLATTGG